MSSHFKGGLDENGNALAAGERRHSGHSEGGGRPCRRSDPPLDGTAAAAGGVDRLSPGPSGDPCDASLLAATARGDLHAFQAFYERHAGRVLAYARRIGQDPVLAQDVTQEVFLAVWTRAATYRPDRGGAPAWLYTLTRNKLVDHWRKSGKDGQMEALDDGCLPHPEHRDRDLALTLRQALSRVDPDQRWAIEMAYYGGLTYEEAAERLELPLGTLKSRIRVGLRALREVLAPH
jgi:RNA polymerase sigma-70 factor, ECF subfamily